MADNINHVVADKPELRQIPDQVVPAGKAVNINFAQYASFNDSANIEFTIDSFPEGLSINSKTGELTGQAPKIELNESFLVSVTLTNLDTQEYMQSIFNFEVVGTILLETEEGKAFFTQEPMNLWDAAQHWEIQLFLQQLIIEHFAWVMLYDGDKPDANLGKLLGRRVSNTGWDVIDYENATMITPGNKAFEQYGNRSRILNTLRDLMLTEMQQKKWQNIMLDGSDIESIGKAWVVAKELNVPVGDIAPSDVAEINLYNIQRIYADNTPSKPKPQPRG